MATLEELTVALDNADKAGDTQAAEELAAAIKQMQGISARGQRIAAPSTTAYVEDRAKAGLVQGTDWVATIMSTLYGDKNPFDVGTKKGQEFGQGIGFKDYKEPDWLSGTLGAGAEALTNPFNYAFGDTNVLKNAASNILPGMAGYIGARVGKELGGDKGEIAGGIAGGITGGLANTVLGRIPKAVSAVASGTYKGAQWVKNNGAEEVTKKASLLAEQHIKNVIRAAAEFDPNIRNEISKLQAQANITGETLPISSIAENPVIRAAIGAMSFKDPKFAGQFTKQFEAAKIALAKEAGDTFGDPAGAKEAIEGILEQYAKDAPDIFAMKALHEQQMKGMDIQAFNTSQPLAPKTNAPTAEGRVMRALFGSKENPSPRSIPFWNAADSKAKELDVFLPENGVREIYHEVGGATKEKIFERFPRVLELVRSKFAPVVDPNNPRARQWNPASYDEVRSLQKEISNELRGLRPSSPTYESDKRFLSELATKVDDQMDTHFPSEVLEPLKKARNQYAFDMTLKDLGENAFNDKGIFDKDMFEKWLSNPSNKSAVQRLIEPTTGDKLNDKIGSTFLAVSKVLKEKEELASVFTTLQQEKISKIMNMTPKAIVNKIYSDGRFTKEVLDKFERSPEALNALRSWMLDDILVSPSSIKILTEDKNKVSAFARVFGMTYLEKVRKLAEVADTLKKNPADIGHDLSSAPKDVLEQLIPGINIPSVASRLRNPVMSTRQAVVELFSRSLAAKTELSYEARLKDLLLDPKKIGEVLDDLNTVQQGGQITPKSALAKALELGIKWGIITHPASIGNHVVSGGMVGATQKRD